MKWRKQVLHFINEFRERLRISLEYRQRRLMDFGTVSDGVTLDDALDAWGVHDRFEDLISDTLRQLDGFDEVTYRDLFGYYDSSGSWHFEEIKRHFPDVKELESLETVMRGILESDYREQADLSTKFPALGFGRRTSVIFWISIFFYSTARITMLALAFSTLRAMPASLYETTWINVIPNVT